MATFRRLRQLGFAGLRITAHYSREAATKAASTAADAGLDERLRKLADDCHGDDDISLEWAIPAYVTMMLADADAIGWLLFAVHTAYIHAAD